MTKKIEWKLCPVTKYEIIRTYAKSDLHGEEGVGVLFAQDFFPDRQSLLV